MNNNQDELCALKHHMHTTIDALCAAQLNID